MNTDTYFRGYRLSEAKSGETMVWYGTDMIEVAQSRDQAVDHINGWLDAA